MHAVLFLSFVNATLCVCSPAVGVLAVLLGVPLKGSSQPRGAARKQIFIIAMVKKTTTLKNLSETVFSKDLLLKPHILIAQFFDLPLDLEPR